MGMARLLFIVATVAIIMFAECTRKGTDPASGFTVEYGCYKSKCWAYCNVKTQINLIFCCKNQLVSNKRTSF